MADEAAGCPRQPLKIEKRDPVAFKHRVTRQSGAYWPKVIE